MALYKIVQVGDPVLRQRARALTDDEVASPQIGESLQLVVIEDPPQLHAGLTAEQLAERERAAVPFHVLINPTLAPEGNDMVLAYEGCLSFSGFMMVVPRWRSVRVEALDEHGAPVGKVASGWYARILQHEVDHLRGVVCCDRMDPRTLTTHDNHMRHWRGLSLDEVRARIGAPSDE